MSIPMGKYSALIKSIQKDVTPVKISALAGFTDDLDFVKQQVEIESRTEAKDYVGRMCSVKNQPLDQNWVEVAFKKQSGRKIGIISEYVAILGFLLKVPHLSNLYGSSAQLCFWDNKNKVQIPVKSILDITAGSSRGGEIDVLAVDEANKKVICFSCKLRKIYDGTIHWGDTEVDRMSVIESRFNKSFDTFNKETDYLYGTFIFDRTDIKNNSKKYKNTIIHDWKDLKIIWKQVFDILCQNGFDATKINKIVGQERKHLVPRFHQETASEAAINYWTSSKRLGDKRFFLFDHICRSGKTITALYTCKKMGFKNVLLLTNFPCINEMEWGDTIGAFFDFEYWNFVNFSGHTGTFYKNKCNFVAVSFADLKSNDKENVLYGWDKAKFADIRDQHWDCIIVDEVHYGYETEKSKSIVDGLDFDFCLALSATPFVNYFKNTFDASNTHRWTIFDEKESAKQYKVYADYPNMHFLLFSPPKNIYAEFLSEWDEEDGLTFRKLLRLKEDKTFFYERDIDSIIGFVFGEKNPKYNSRKTPFGWARGNGVDKVQGILIFVPETDHCKPLQQRLLANKTVQERFGTNVYYTYADLNKSGEIKGWLKKHAVAPFIIIAVGQLTTGVTVADVDTVMLMDDGESPQQLMQRMFRCRTAVGGKTGAFVIDLNPARTLRMVYEYTSTLASIDGISQRDYFKKWFDLMPVVYCEENKMVDCSGDLDKIFQAACSKYYDCFGKGSLIKEMPESVMSVLDGFTFSDGKNNKKEQYAEGIDKGKSFKKGKSGHSGGSGTNEKYDEETREQMARKKMIAIFQSIAWASVLTGGKLNSYQEIFQALDNNPDLKREYDKLLFD